MTGACFGSAPSRCATQSIQMPFSSINHLDWKGIRVSLQVNDPIRSNLIVISAVVDHYSIMLRLWCGLTEVAQFISLQQMYSVKALVSMLIFPLHFPSDFSVALFVHRCPLGMSFFFHLWIPAFVSCICFFNSLISSMPVLVCLCQRTGEDSTEASADQQCNQRFAMWGGLKSQMKQNLTHTFLSAFPKPIMKTKYSFMHLCISENCLSQRKKKYHSLIKAWVTFIIKNQSNECAFFFGITLQSAMKRGKHHRGEHRKGQKEEEKKRRHMVVSFSWKIVTFYC